MKESRRLELQAILDRARAAHDAVAEDGVLRIISRETLECTAHTSERVKKIEQTVTATQSVVNEINSKITRVKDIGMVLKIAIEVARYLIPIGGATYLLKLLGGA